MSGLPPSWKSEIENTINEAVNDSESAKDRKDEGHHTSIAIPLHHLCQEFIEYKKQQETNDEKRSLRERATIGALVFTAIAAFLTLIVFKNQLNEMAKVYDPIKISADAAVFGAKAAQDSANAAKASADVARQALVNAQRAFVFINKIEQARIAPTGTEVTAWDFLVEFKNSGNTPTKTMTFHLNIKAFDGQLPDGFDFSDLANGSENTVGFIPPQSTAGATDLVVPVQDIEAVIAGSKTLFIWGWIEYDDMFENTPIHRVEYADQIFIVGDAKTDKNRVQHRLYRRHNRHYDVQR